MIEPPATIRRLVYLGTPAMAVPPLYALHEAGFEIPLVVSRADKRRGRGGDLTPSPVKRAAQKLGLETTSNVDDALDVEADLGVVVAFGRLIKPHVLDVLPMINLHFSLLPRWRGAAPTERALLAGDPVTGVCVMRLEESLDTGPIYRQVDVPIAADTTLDVLRSELVSVGTALLVSALQEGLGTPVPQEGDITYAEKITPDELRVDWSDSAEQIERLVRLGNAWTTVRGKRLKIWAAAVERESVPAGSAPGALEGLVVATGDGALRLIEVQPEGKPRRSAHDWGNGVRLGADEVLGE